MKDGEVQCFEGFWGTKFLTLFLQKRALDSFDFRRSMWYLNDKCSSNKIPRSLYDREDGLSWLECSDTRL